MDINAICEALATNLEPLLEKGQVLPYVLSNPTPPTIMVDVGAQDYGLSMTKRGFTECTFIVWAIVGLTDDVGAQKKLRRMMATSGDESISELLQADVSLGGLGRLVVQSRTGARRYSGEARGSYLGAEWTVIVRGGA